VSLFKNLFGKAEENQPVITIGGDETPAQTADAVASSATTGKIKLNFKKLPKKVVQAIADETTGQETDRSNDEDNRRRGGQSGSGLTDAFNAAANGALRTAQAEIDRKREEEIRDREMIMRRPAAAPPRPRAPSPGL
jgi:hypothetical protein